MRESVGGFRFQPVFLNTAALIVLFIGYFLSTGTGFIEGEVFKNLFRFAAFALLFLNIVFSFQINRNVLFLMVFFLMYSLLMQSQVALNIFFLLLIYLSISRLSSKEIALALLIPVVVVVVIHLLFFFTGLIVDKVTDYGGRLRSTLGFSNPNQVSAIYLSLSFISLFYSMVYKTRKSFIFAIILTAFSIYVFLISNSRTSLVGVLVLLFLLGVGFFGFRFKFYRKSLVFIGFLSPFFMVFQTYYLAYYASPELDELFSYRLSGFYEFINNITVFELFAGWPDNEGVDSLYLMLISGVGLVLFSFILFYVSFVALKIKYDYIPFFLVMLLISFAEAFLLRPEIPMSCLFVVILLSPYFRRSLVN